MAKNKIIKDLVNDEVPLPVVLNRLYVLASEMELEVSPIINVNKDKPSK